MSKRRAKAARLPPARLFRFYRGMRHVVLCWGAAQLVLIPALFRPSPLRPYCWLAWPWQSGGTLLARAGGLQLVWGCW